MAATNDPSIKTLVSQTSYANRSMASRTTAAVISLTSLLLSAHWTSTSVAAFKVDVICRGTPSGGSSFRSQRARSHLHALPPIGPFCCFRSAAATRMDPFMASMATSASSELPRVFQKFVAQIEAGITPDSNEALKLSELLEETVDTWETTLARCRLSKDFQTREFFVLTEATLNRCDQTVKEMAASMRWQASSLKAMAFNQPPPMPPPELDLNKLLETGQAAMNDNKIPDVAAMSSASPITATPFSPDSPILNSPIVKQEFEQLCTDHDSLIQMGGSYGDFDPLGKIIYVDQLEAIEERWDILLARFQLTGQLNSDFVAQCNEFLRSMALDETTFRSLLKQSHAMLREEAEAERARMLG